MGCGTAKSAAVVLPVATPPHTSPHLFSLAEPKAIYNTGPADLHAFAAIWLDPKANSPENAAVRKKLEQSFGQASFIEKIETLQNVIKDASRPVVLICSEQAFSQKSVSETAEKEHDVSAVVIFGPGGEKENNKLHQGKVVASVSTLESLEKVLGPIYGQYSQYQRFFDDRTQKTFYTIEDREVIVNSLTVKAEGDEFSIFFPLGMGAIDLPTSVMTRTIFEKIEGVARTDPELKAKLEAITRTVAYLRQEVSMGSVLKSYTKDGLYYMLNLYLRYGKQEGFQVFKEYMFALKGSMCELGKPVINKGLKLYRGVKWDRKFLLEYQKRKGQTVLLNAFVSTTLLKDIAIKFAKFGGRGDSSTLMEVRLVEFDASFAKFVSDFRFPEENGVFFPVDISAHSEFADESEVLFPPFYPVRIVEVCEESSTSNADEKYDKIIVEAPYCVNIAGKDNATNYLKHISKKQDWTKSYLDSIIRLCGSKILDKLSIVKLGILDYAPAFENLLAGIRSAGYVQNLILENERLGPDHAGQLFSALAGLRTLQVASLNFNCLGDGGIKPIADLLKEDNSKINTLNIQTNGITKSGAEFLAAAIRLNKSLKALDLNGNQLGDEGAVSLFDAAQNNRTLECVKLVNNGITEEGGREVVRLLDMNTAIKELNLDGNDISTTIKVGISLALLVNNADFMRIFNDSCSSGTIATQGVTAKMATLDFSRRMGMAGYSLRKVGCALKFETILRTLNMNQRSISAECIMPIIEGVKLGKNLSVLLLKANKIGDEGAVALAEAVTQSSTLTILNLSDNAIETEGVKALGEMLKSDKCKLRVLKLARNWKTGLEGFRSIIEALGVNTVLEHLNLSRNSMQAMPELESVLGEKNKTLRRLNIGYNGWGTGGGKILSNVLMRNSTLNSLSFGGNKFDENAVKELVEAMKKNVTLKTLNWKEGNVGVVGVKALAENHTLEDLNFCFNHLGDEGAELISEARSLKSLNLCRNFIGIAGLKHIALGLIQTPSRLATLNLSRNDITDEGIKIIAEAMKLNVVVTSLDIRDNKCGVEGAKAVADMLKSNRTLTALCLRGNQSVGEGSVAVANALLQNNTLVDLNMFCCKIAAKGTKALAEAIRKNTSLRSLDIGFNGIVATEGCEIADALRANKGLTSLSMVANKLEDKVAEALISALYHNKTLTFLNVENAAITPALIDRIQALVDSDRSQLREPEKFEPPPTTKKAKAGSDSDSKLNKVIKLIENKTAATFCPHSEGCEEELGILSGALKVNTMLRELTLGSHFIGDTGAKILAEGIRQNHGLTILLMPDCAVTAVGCRALVDAMMAGESVVSELNLSRNTLGEEGAKAMAQLIEYSKTLSVLDLAATEVNSSGGKLIAEAIRKNGRLVNLKLGENNVGNEGANAVATMLRENSSLGSLDLSTNDISDEGVASIFGALQSNHTLSDLKLDDVKVENVKTAECVGQSLSLSKTLVRLEMLKIKVSADCLKLIVEALGTNSCLKEFNVGGDTFDENVIKALADSLRKNCTLARLSLCGTFIGHEEMPVLAEALKNNKGLTALNLSNCYISGCKVNPLAEMLWANGSRIKDLNLSHNTLKGKDDAGVVADLIKGNTTVTTLDLSFNEFKEEGTKVLLEVLKNDKTLKRLNYSNIKVEEESTLIMFGELLRYNTTLEELNLSTHWFPPDSALALSEALKANTTLKTLYLALAYKEMLQGKLDSPRVKWIN